MFISTSRINLGVSMTSFLEIYDRAVFKMMNYDFLKLDSDSKEKILYMYLLSAQADFAPSCLSNLYNVDVNNTQYNETLDEEAKEVLATGIAYYWVSSQALNTNLLRSRLSSKEFNVFSPGNLLKEIRALRNDLKKEFYGKIVRYSNRHLT